MTLAVAAGMKITTSVLAITILAASTPAFAAEDANAKSEAREEGAPRIVMTMPAGTRPSALPAMYVSLAALQAYDGYATLRGVRGGATEMNPLVGGLASQPVPFWALKAVSTVTSIYFAEQLWRQHKRGRAIATMVVANAVMGAVAARNASV